MWLQFSSLWNDLFPCTPSGSYSSCMSTYFESIGELWISQPPKQVPTLYILIPGYTWAMITLFLLGKLVIALCFTGAVTYTMELFPTSARGTLLGICALASRSGGMLAPLTPILVNILSTSEIYLKFCSFLSKVPSNRYRFCHHRFTFGWYRSRYRRVIADNFYSISYK